MYVHVHDCEEVYAKTHARDTVIICNSVVPKMSSSCEALKVPISIPDLKFVFYVKLFIQDTAFDLKIKMRDGSSDHGRSHERY